MTSTERLSYKKLQKEVTSKLPLASKTPYKSYPSTLIFFLIFLTTESKELVKLLINIGLFM